MWPNDPEFHLSDGRKIHLVEFLRRNAYHGLLEGAPFRQSNHETVLGLIHWEKTNLGWATQGHAPALLPTRILNVKTRAWERVDWYDFQGIPEAPPPETKRMWPEWMPGVATVALFISDPIQNDPMDGQASYLSVIWFQRGFEELIEEQPLEELRKVPWDAMAASWIF